jgi:hypothetical protein
MLPVADMPVESQAYYTTIVFEDSTEVAELSRLSIAFMDIVWVPDVVDKILPVYEKLTLS